MDASFFIIIGLAVSVIAKPAFEFSRSFTSLLFQRTVVGLASFNVAIVRTVKAEIVQQRRFQTKAFLLLTKPPWPGSERRFCVEEDWSTSQTGKRRMAF